MLPTEKATIHRERNQEGRAAREETMQCIQSL